MLWGQKSSMKYSPTWVKTSAKEVSRWKTHGSPKDTFYKMRNSLFAMLSVASTLSGIFQLNAPTFKSLGVNVTDVKELYPNISIDLPIDSSSTL
ncbi:hypothetical protein PoB_001896700 [Plakobranchus ocellatus]|uniref:Uncharacterized protein n=1 Tax=Plakobranchus ocellatus TaxID=259542 RepID=A0AAV3ZB30_9GAST|nr:hypothetical protein PoB_001896700 [Plakobranchus ocellatus]